ncbi:uncharacterized protein PGTG_19855 [Puccinia graminis f. sp. tritici CRL 75-36-700-3]|uniref:Pentafunctional AROM polypeptide n=1 Tax=Puccinia graminis f. sp. tritici (strain CRL 75-36-700-3 / race SCCL) TaxID=418459 RepID=E3LB95_PUCGT|nr:uncharacterized protein PGTG_19855 [Puccinia graminis f. sp. tritici CRL 75-36-700-3]EFP93820.1 hypothetical protein PGTG_19855 [Puccinia graminis f. sp. tritici CRL 75-36-700-3]
MAHSVCDLQTVPILGKPSIRLGYHLAPYIAHTVLTELQSSTYVLITDSNVSPRHAPALKAAFENQLPKSARLLTYILPPGEQSKCREMKALLEDWLLDHRCTRDTVVLALGGGVIGDLIGFVSATFMRGIRFCQIPTTLLAMVDSSVGGKTAIDTPLGKNLVGAFWQPSFIFIDASYLETLPEREFVNGMAEMIKTAAIWDESQFEKLESNVDSIRSAVLSPPPRDPINPFPGRDLASRSQAQKLLLEVIADSVGVKSEVVTKDEKETGLRNLVNFGHTIGHAIEAVLTPAILHGECVSIGMILEAEVARARGCLSSSAIARLSKCLKAHGLPVSLTDPRILSSPNAPNLNLDRLLDLMSVDKKNEGKVKKIVLLSRIGKTLEERATGVEDSLIRRVLAPAPDGKHVYLGNAGTAARFLTTVCSLVKSQVSNQSSTVITGNARMQERPIGPLVDTLRTNGVQIDYLRNEGCLPLRISPEDGFPGGMIELAASVSSQYVSSVLLSAPFAQAPVTLSLVGGAVISQPYIDITISMMSTFGIQVERVKDPATGLPSNTYRIPNGTYKNPPVYEIESDASSATYPLAMAALNGLSITLETIGSGSLQGDAQFAKKVLEPMGCQVIQTERETKVIGPSAVSELRQLGEIDMEEMTDAFLTACVVLGVAAQHSEKEQRMSTRIIGIANQRVKECNRIAAMVAELGKMGIHAQELEDGIEVFGTPVDALAKRGDQVRINCYDDHRIAMAFSVLGTVPGGKGLILNEKRCVEKTWPSWWDDLSTKLGIQLDGLPAQEKLTNTASAVAWEAKKPETPSILLCGMRGSGKSFSGQVAASTLGWPLIDTDLYFQEKCGCSIREFIQKNDWSRFREEECTVLEEILKEFPSCHVISLGGGIVETEKGRKMLMNYANSKGPVVEIIRPVEEVIAYLNEDGNRPSLGESIEQIWARREPWYRLCSNSEYFNLVHPAVDHALISEVQHAKRAMQQFFRFITGVDTNHVLLDPPVPRNTHFLCLTFPSLSPCREEDKTSLDRFEELTIGCDAVELRVDLLSTSGKAPTSPSIPPTEFVVKQVAALRRLTTLPIIYTVRTCSQGGMFPDGQPEEWCKLAAMGFRTGCEYVDIELGLSPEQQKALCSQKGHSKIIASYHDFSGRLKWDSSEMIQRYHELKAYGDMVKLVSRAADGLEDNLAMLEFRKKHATLQKDRQSLITINMGRSGQMSRILSPVLSPTTHPLLPGPPAAPGQLSFRQIQTAQGLLGQIIPKQFWLFGAPIGQSRSPLIHGTGFDTLGLEGYRYQKCETSSVTDSTVLEKIHASDFGGASVTIPLKVEIIKYLDQLTPDAQAVGAVNTIVPVSQRDGKIKLLGANTDWEAIKMKIEANLPAQQALGLITPGQLVRAAGVVIGAGGTARAAVYALHSLGYEQIYIHNRTRSKAEEVAQAFPSYFGIRVIDSLGFLCSGEDGVWQPSAIISAVPAQATRLSDDPPADRLEIPHGLFDRPGGGVVIEMSYALGKDSALLRAVQDLVRWKSVDGLQVLVQQAARQFQLWTGKHLSMKIVSQAVYQEASSD